MDSYTIIPKLQKLKPQLQEQCGLSNIGLFGSYSRNEQTQNSDIDLVVDFNVKSYKNYIQTIRILENEFTGFDVQVVSLKAIKPDYFEFIKQDIINA